MWVFFIVWSVVCTDFVCVHVVDMIVDVGASGSVIVFVIVVIVYIWYDRQKYKMINQQTSDIV